MAIFEYKAYDHARTLIQDQVSADDERSARALLREQGLYPIELKTLSGNFKLEPKALTKSLSDSFKSSFNELKTIQTKLSETDEEKSYEYVAQVILTGQTISGEIAAADLKEARQKIRLMDLYPLEVKERKKTLKDKGGISHVMSETFERVFPAKVNLKELGLLTRQLSSMLSAGLSLVKALGLAQKNVRDTRLRKAFHHVRLQLQEGQDFTTALSDYKELFPASFIELTVAGEQGGNLEVNLERAATYIEKQIELRNKIKAAVTYPIMVLGIIGLIVMAMLVFVIPQFIPLFEEFNLKLPWLTRVMIGFSDFVTNYWWSLPIIFVLLIWFFRVSYQVPILKNYYQKFMIAIPMIGPLIYKVLIARIVYTIGVTLRSGVPIRTTLGSLKSTVDNVQLQLKLDDILDGIEKGEQMSKKFEESRLFPDVVTHLIRVGEETGKMDEMLERAAGYLDQEIDLGVKQLLAAMEPLLTVLMGGMVFIMVGSVYLPIFDLIMNAGSAVNNYY